MSKLALVAIGGNSLLRAGERGTIEEQRANAALTARDLVRLIQHGYHLVLTHGNGPQVGAQWLRSEIASAQVSPEPLDVCVADTEGAIGYILESALQDALADARLAIPVATIIAQVVVDAADPAFQHPTKPVGPFYTAEEARRREQQLGWRMVEDAARGYRRVVPSPAPLEIVEIDAIGSMVHDGYLVITAGGGGIPVVRRGQHLVGAEAVIDKDSASGLLAHLLGVETLFISTATEHVYLNYAHPEQRPLARLTVSEAQGYLEAGQFPPGSMGPKIAAAIRFLRGGGKNVIITTPECLLDAALGRTGTWIVADRS
jgi:carbamate kinase